MKGRHRSVRVKPVFRKRDPVYGINKRTLSIVEGKMEHKPCIAAGTNTRARWEVRRKRQAPPDTPTGEQAHTSSKDSIRHGEERVPSPLRRATTHGNGRRGDSEPNVDVIRMSRKKL